MSKKLISTLIILMSISLLGIIGVQILWIKNAIHIQEKAFDSNINKVLHQIVQNLEKKENVFLIGKGLHAVSNEHPSNIEIHAIRDFIDKKENASNHHIKIKTTKELLNKNKGDTQIIVSANSNSHKTLKFWHSNNQSDSTIDIDIQVTNLDTIIRMENKERQIENIVEKVVYEFKSKDITIADRINKEDLPSEIATSLLTFNISTPFDYAIIDGDSKKIVTSSDSTLNRILTNSPHRINLFPNDIFLSNNQLFLNFPDRFTLVYQSIFTLLILSALFTLFIIFTFANAIYFILKQKRISDIKSDFINNITHEFKTPIATIALASDSINNAKVIDQPDRIRYFTSIIKDENFRMNKQVENILQLSLFGKHELNINPQTNHLNEILQKAGEHIQLQINEKGGSLAIKLEAVNDICDLDEVHFLNTIFNLLDNSIKYSLKDPQIEIGTREINNKIQIWVKDLGIGMSPDTRKRAFKKFFRAETGNIHNVKGFGLGLSYVKLIVEKHNGTIEVSSKQKEGTTVFITLPLKV